MEPKADGEIPASIPTAPELTPVPPRPKQFGVLFWATLVAILGLVTVIAIPNFVKARTTTCKNACVANLKQIDGAVQQWALENKKAGTDLVTISDILAFLKGSVLPACPANGTFSVTTVSATPICSQAAVGHSL